ncbi:MAG: hypothetical protein Tsb0032_12820 [Kiloniellaceae bacterium]
MRSGTSLLQHVLCSSPDANPFIHGSRYLTSQIGVFAQYAGKDSLYVKDYLGGREELVAFSRDIVDRLLAETHRRLGAPKHLVLKNPELSSYLPQAELLMPQARFVISLRDPKDTIASMIGVGEKHRQSGVVSFLARAGRDIRQLCNSYSGFYIPVLRVLQAGGGLEQRVCFSAYEDLISETEKSVARLSEFCAIPLSLEHLASEAGWRSNFDGEADELSRHPHWSAYLTELSGGPISQASIGRYRDVLSDAEAAEVDRRCGELYRSLTRRAA